MIDQERWLESVARIREARAQTLDGERRRQLLLAGAPVEVAEAWTSSLRWREDVLPPAGMTQALYRYFDIEGRLLYLGFTERPNIRFVTHASKSPWIIFAVRVEIRWYPSRATAESAERTAIRIERPVFNRVHNTTVAAQRRTVAYLIEVGRLDLAPATVTAAAWRRMTQDDPSLVPALSRAQAKRAGDRRLLELADLEGRLVQPTNVPPAR